MFLSKQMLRSKLFCFIIGSVSVLLPWYTWKRLFKQIQLKRAEKLFYHRHNCCVRYFKDKGFTGWPPNKQKNLLLLNEEIYQPLLYFLETAKCNIDIAVMILNVRKIEEVLCQIAKKGVVIRLIMDYDKSQSKTIEKLTRAGVYTKLFVNVNPDAECMMHHKYAVKDCNGSNGFLVFGSLNWTMTGVTNNYEDLVFTTNKHAVKSYAENFEYMWSYLTNAEEHDITTQAILNEKIKVL